MSSMGLHNNRFMEAGFPDASHIPLSCSLRMSFCLSMKMSMLGKSPADEISKKVCLFIFCMCDKGLFFAEPEMKFIFKELFNFLFELLSIRS